jgi:hypothetical protein
MKLSAIPAGYWLIIALVPISVGLIGTLFVPKPPSCMTDGILEVQVGDTVWVLPEEETRGLSVKRRNGHGHVCEPPSGVIRADFLMIENVGLGRTAISIQPYRGGTRFSERFSGRCYGAAFITITGADLGQQCQAYRSLGETTVRITYYSADWPRAQERTLFKKVDFLLAEKRRA